MGELLNRSFQHDILQLLANSYPQSTDPNKDFAGIDDNSLSVNLMYLSEHGLVTVNSQTLLSGDIIIGSAKITARGLDFLAADGGLSAVLGVVTVKLHDETIRDLLINRIDTSDADPTTKGQLTSAIRRLPADALTLLMKKALENGIEALPAAIAPLRQWLEI
jgi:hypothetical protein